jgi:hypothetical protein
LQKIAVCQSYGDRRRKQLLMLYEYFSEPLASWACGLKPGTPVCGE